LGEKEPGVTGGRAGTMNARLIHDAAFAMAQALVDLLGTCLRDEERQDAREEFYRVCKAGLEAFCIHQDRMRQRLKPLQN
jgi:hypothetical protein